MKQRLFVFLCFFFYQHSLELNAQSTLPSFNLKELSNGKIKVSWLNPHKNCIKLSVQRSTDLTTFQTLVWAQTPNMYDNEYIDEHPEKYALSYYRIFYVLKGGKYFFSKILTTKEHPETDSKKELAIAIGVENNLPAKFNFKVSNYVFSFKKGIVTVRLPEAKQHKYSLIFYDSNGIELFHINQLKEPELFIDKSNFIHTGWFVFELFEDDKLKEKNKILITTD